MGGGCGGRRGGEGGGEGVAPPMARSPLRRDGSPCPAARASRCKGRWQNLADFQRLRNGLDRRDRCTPALVTPRNHMLLYLLCRWFHHRWRTQCVGKSITNSSLSRRKRRTLGSSKKNVRASSMGS